LVLLAPTWALAQALPNPPPPPPTDTEIQLARIENVVEVLARADEFRRAEDWRRYALAMQRVVQLRPYSGPAWYELARAYALQGDKQQSYGALIQLQRMGLSLDPASDKDFAKVADTEAFKHIAEGLRANGTPFGEGRPAFTLSGAPELIESLAYDAAREVFLVGSMRTGEIFRVDRQGRATRFIAPDEENGLWGVFSLLVDEKRGRLWVGSSAVPSYQGFDRADFGRAALFSFALDSGRLLERHAVPFDGQPHVFAALALGPDGSVYASDVLSRTVFRLRDGKLSALVTSDQFTSLRGLVVSPDNKHLYLADSEMGLHVADLGKNQIIRLLAPHQNFGGIDGLYWYRGQLVAIQNGTRPTRVLRIALGADGRSIARVQPLEANKPELLLPTYGVVVGKDLYYIANSQRDFYDGSGRIIEGQSPVARVIFRTPLEFAWQDPAKPRTAAR
jgi:sugar lactone lactonase YvrE